MTALEARRNPQLRSAVALACRTSDRTVADLLDGYPPREALRDVILAQLKRRGVDEETVPMCSAADLARHRVDRRARRCTACEDKDEEIAELRRQLATLRGQAPVRVNGSERASGLMCVPCDDSGIEVAATEGKAG